MLKKMTFSTKKLARRAEERLSGLTPIKPPKPASLAVLHSAKAGLGGSASVPKGTGYAALSAIAESGASNYIKENKLSLFEGDCLKIMPSIEEKSIDLILCDLPYGITRNK